MSIVHSGLCGIGKLAVRGMEKIGTRNNENIENTLLNEALNKKIYGSILVIVSIATVILLLPYVAKGAALATLVITALFIVDLSLFVVGYDLFKMGMNIAKFATNERKKATCFLQEKGIYRRATAKEQENTFEHRRWICYTRDTFFLQHIVHLYLSKEKPKGNQPDAVSPHSATLAAACEKFINTVSLGAEFTLNSTTGSYSSTNTSNDGKE